MLFPFTAPSESSLPGESRKRQRGQRGRTVEVPSRMGACPTGLGKIEEVNCVSRIPFPGGPPAFRT